MTINAFFNGTILNIYVNGRLTFCNDFYAYTNHQVVISGSTVYAHMTTPTGSRHCMSFEYNENGNCINMRQEYV